MDSRGPSTASSPATTTSLCALLSPSSKAREVALVKCGGNGIRADFAATRGAVGVVCRPRESIFAATYREHMRDVPPLSRLQCAAQRSLRMRRCIIT